jgi:hypothetical protein
MKINHVYMLLLTAFLGLSVGCSKETDKDRLGDAQSCLDTATTSTAQSCVAKIADIQTPQANMLRCSAGFIQEGFDNTRLVEAVQSLSGTQGTSEFLSNIAFHSLADAASNLDFVNATNTYCQSSGQTFLGVIGNAAASATMLIKLSGGTLDPNNLPDATTINSAISTMIDSSGNVLSGQAANVTAIGNLIVGTYQTGCTGDTQVNKDLCDQLTNAINTSGADLSDPEAVGAQVLLAWLNNTH